MGSINQSRFGHGFQVSVSIHKQIADGAKSAPSWILGKKAAKYATKKSVFSLPGFLAALQKLRFTQNLCKMFEKSTANVPSIFRANLKHRCEADILYSQVSLPRARANPLKLFNITGGTK